VNWTKNSHPKFFDEFELENFGKYVPKFLVKDKIGILGGLKRVMGGGEENLSYMGCWLRGPQWIYSLFF
jgi:hypothetical protein